MAVLNGIVTPRPEEVRLEIQCSYDAPSHSALYSVTYDASAGRIFEHVYPRPICDGDYSGLRISEIFGAAHHLEQHLIPIHDAMDGSPRTRFACLIANEGWIEVMVQPHSYHAPLVFVSSWSFQAELMESKGLLWKTWCFRMASTPDQVATFAQQLWAEYMEQIYPHSGA